MNRRQDGVALIQVLFVTAIILLLVVQLSLTAREQVRRAQALQTRSEAALFLQSRESALLYTLLTEPLFPDPGSVNHYAANWNFFGQAFTVDAIDIRLQDQSGLMRMPANSTREFEELVEILGYGPREARRAAEQLDDWLGLSARGEGFGVSSATLAGKGGAIQYFGELRLLDGIDESLYRQLAELMTLFPTPGFNPLTAPAPLLRLRMSRDAANAVLKARARGELDQDRLWDIARIGGDETTALYPGPGIGIELAGGYEGVALQRRLMIRIEPYAPEPLAVWSRERFPSGVPK
jgi:type II secretory pathway component PulK